jgi:hypothetical protein
VVAALASDRQSFRGLGVRTYEGTTMADVALRRDVVRVGTSLVENSSE